MRVALRVDGSAPIGYGHLRRCVSLAKALRRAGALPHFYWREIDFDAGAVAQAAGFDATRLGGSAPPDNIADADAFIKALEAQPVALVIVDHYGLDARWHDRVREAIRRPIVVIDDLADRPLAPDVLVDHNPDADHARKYARVLGGRSVRLLGGARFALLDPRFASSSPIRIHPRVASIGVFMGGTDPINATPKVVDACRRIAGFSGSIEVVTTSANPRLAQWQEAFASDPKLHIAVDLPDLSGFFSRHDLQIGAGGGAAWERCCLGVPSIVVAVADNQRVVLSRLGEAGAAMIVDSLDAYRLGALVGELCASQAARERLGGAARALIDGRGAERVALCLLAGELILREATAADAATMHAWRNHPATRAVSRSEAEIPYAEHERWLKRRLASVPGLLWIAHIGACDVGVVRFDEAGGGEYEISIYLDPALNALGLGQAVIGAAEGKLRAERPDATLISAQVIAHNAPSRRLFERCGYRAEAGRYTKRLGSFKD